MKFGLRVQVILLNTTLVKRKHISDTATDDRPIKNIDAVVNDYFRIVDFSVSDFVSIVYSSFWERD